MPKPNWKQLKNDLMELHQAALSAADPKAAVERHLTLEEGDRLALGGETIELTEGARIWLIALGKASLGMTEAAFGILGSRVTAGVVSHPKALQAPGGWPETIQVFGSGHPLPDENSIAAGEAAAALVVEAKPEDVVLVLISGGGSALMEKLQPGLELEDLQPLTKALQHAGADIFELNTVRRAISQTKGGGLARMVAPARVVSLALSDVLDDSPESIAAGPTVPSPTGPREAISVLKRYKLTEEFEKVVQSLEAAAKSTAKKNDEEVENIYLIVGSNRLAAEAACEQAQKIGFESILMTTCLEGEASEVGRMIGSLARSVRAHEVPMAAPTCLVLGGETTVTVKGDGRGGRNLELALGAAFSLHGIRDAAVLSFATDGVDGSSDSAGAYATGETMPRCSALGLTPHEFLEKSDSWAFFQALGDLWVTGPTGTNVNDLALVLVYP
jgi:hydroxypyruvate reductase